MRIVDNRRISEKGRDGLETSGDGAQITQYHEHRLRILSQSDGRTVDGQQIRGIETPDKMNGNLSIVNQKLCPFEMCLQYFPFEIGDGLQ